MTRPITTIAGILAGAALLAAGFTFSVPGTQAQAGGAAATFKTKCAVCHGAGGKGDTPAGKSMGTPDFTSAAFASKSEAELKGSIEKGKNKMPAYGKTLKPEDIQALVAYIKSLK
jgi:mono/diheme cytochrome c family protein